MNTPYVFKKCSKCGRWLVASTVNFHKNKDGKYGLRADCKECYNAHYRKHYHENIEKERARSKNYYYDNIEKEKERATKYQAEHREKKREYDRKWYKTPQGQVVAFNARIKRRQKEEQQGNGITPDQWLEMMNFFDWKCAYSGEYIGSKENQSIRSIDHIVPLVKGGAHEIWNCVPMYRPFNSSKNDKDLEEWYLQQDFYSEDRLNKINEWREYAYNKWSNDEIQKTI